MSFADKVLVATPAGAQQMTLATHDADEGDAFYRVVGRDKPIPRSDVLSRHRTELGRQRQNPVRRAPAFRRESEPLQDVSRALQIGSGDPDGLNAVG